MPSAKTLNAKNLEALGAKRLAALLLEISKGDAASKRRLRLELAGTQGAPEVAREVRKRLATIARSRSFIDWQKRKGVVNDLQTQRTAIMEKVAKSDPTTALDLMWSFMEIAGSIFERSDDSSGQLISVFENACADLGTLAEAAKPDPDGLADRILRALQESDYGEYDEIIGHMTPALGEAGLAILKNQVHALVDSPKPKAQLADRVAKDWRPGEPIYEENYRELYRDSVLRRALLEIADAEGDVDAFISQCEPESRRVPRVAAQIAQRLLAAGRAEEALKAVDAVSKEDRSGWIPSEWEDARIATLEALGRPKDAQEFRWACFHRNLSSQHLKAFLKRLPDFEDMEAEEKALTFVQNHPSFHEALIFLTQWPALNRAAALILERPRELDGNHYDILSPAADALAEKFPLAATLALRAMIEFALEQARTKRYRYAAHHLLDCEGIASRIEDFGGHEDHQAYEDRIRDRHGRKSSFWSLIAPDKP
jgi:hypothetical protein